MGSLVALSVAGCRPSHGHEPPVDLPSAAFRLISLLIHGGTIDGRTGGAANEPRIS